MNWYSQSLPPLRKLVSSSTHPAGTTVAGGAALSVVAGALGLVTAAPAAGSAAGAPVAAGPAVVDWSGAGLAAATCSGVQTVGVRKRSMPMTERIGWPMVNHTSNPTISQMPADEKNSL